MFENFTRILGISLELQAFAIIGERKKLLIHRIILVRSDPDQTGCGSETLPGSRVILPLYVFGWSSGVNDNSFIQRL